MIALTRKQLFYSLLVIFTAALSYAYANHFTNGFYFDDYHTIVNNEFIRDPANIPSFFTDLETFGTMPTNRTYRPVITMLNAIDYWLGDGLNPVSFHISIFISYLLIGVVLYFILFRIFNDSFNTGYNDLIALCSTAFYMLHTSNAETINYIIMRSDSFSTLCMLIGLLAFMHPAARKWQIHVLMILVGIASKESALMLAPLLFIYALLFEQNIHMIHIFRKSSLNGIKSALLASSTVIAAGVWFFWFSRAHFRPEASLFTEPYSDPWAYFITQWYVMAHYIGNFFIPVNLCADLQVTLIHDFWNHKILFSGILMLGLLSLAVITSKWKKYRPVSFGILWFFICLAPTSTIIPFGQVANDHRTFNAYIGLVMALGWVIGVLITENLEKIRATGLRIILIFAAVNLTAGHVFGIRQRNDVWSTEEKLWYDVTLKSPDNSRGLMNYGLALMSQARYEETLKYFNKALEISPHYSYLHINLGILKNQLGQTEEAEDHYQKAIYYDNSNAEAYYYYARFLWAKGRLNEALSYGSQGLAFSPGHSNLNGLMRQLQATDQASPDSLTRAQSNGSDIGNEKDYIMLAYVHYNKGEYEQCLVACQQALQINPNSVEAYNNMCTAYIRLNRIDDAIKACQRALELKPDFSLARNNLAWAWSLKSK